MKINLFIYFLILTFMIGCSESSTENTNFSKNNSSNRMNTKKEVTWKIINEYDELTNAKTPKIYYSSEITFPDFPNGIIELECKCNNIEDTVGTFDTHFKIKGGIPILTLTISNTPNLIVKKVSTVGVLGNESWIGAPLRTVLRDGTITFMNFSQSSDFSNVFSVVLDYDFLSYIVETTIDSEGSIDGDLIIQNFKSKIKSEYPDKLEIQFSNGSIYIVKFDKNYDNFINQCFEKMNLKHIN